MTFICSHCLQSGLELAPPCVFLCFVWLVAMFSSSDLMSLAAQELGQVEHPTSSAEVAAVGASLGTSSHLGVEVGRHATPPPQVATSTPTSLNEAFVAFNLPYNLHSTFLGMIGSEDGEDDAEVVAHVPPEIITSAMDTATDRDARLLTPLQKGAPDEVSQDYAQDVCRGVFFSGPACGFAKYYGHGG